MTDKPFYRADMLAPIVIGDTNHAPCPDYTGLSYNKSTGACSCGAHHSPLDRRASSRSAIERGSCTCCATPRSMHRGTPQDEWQHDDDATYAEVFHVHEDTSGRDCDGQLDHSTTYTIPKLRWRDGELSYKTPPEPDRHDLWTKLARTAAPLHSPCEMTIVDNDDGTLTLNWHRRTDEGSEGGQLRGCVDPTCTDEPARQRDHYAEAMGY